MNSSQARPYIAVTATGRSLNSFMSKKFFSGKYLLVVDPESMGFETIINPAIAIGGLAAIRFYLYQMLESKVSTILTNDCDPRIMKLFGQAGIQIITGKYGSVKKVLNEFYKMSMEDTIVNEQI